MVTAIQSRTIFAILMISALAVSGCGGGESLANISGKVTFNGANIDEGTIIFEGVRPAEPKAEALIEQGHYRAQLAPGEKVVRILGYRVVGERDLYGSRSGKSSRPADGSKIQTKEQFVPSKFNAKTELKCTINTNGETRDFALTP